MESKQDLITSIIGEGIHTGLRKFCYSYEGHVAWQAIKAMPDDDWHGICKIVADEVLKVIND